jgi:hypothetical protein
LSNTHIPIPDISEKSSKVLNLIGCGTSKTELMVALNWELVDREQGIPRYKNDSYPLIIAIPEYDFNTPALPDDDRPMTLVVQN